MGVVRETTISQSQYRVVWLIQILYTQRYAFIHIEIQILFSEAKSL